MADTPVQMVPVHIPAELFAKLEQLKKHRPSDRLRSVEDIVRGLCEDYVRVRESQEWESAHRDEIERSYEKNPDDWNDASAWKKEEIK